MTRARTLADMISDGVIGTTELADDAITPVKLDETGSYAMASLTVADADNGLLVLDETNGVAGGAQSTYISMRAGGSQTAYMGVASSGGIMYTANKYGPIQFMTGPSGTEFSRFILEDTNQAVFNEIGANYDFRVESDNRTHMLFVDAGNDRIGVGTTSPLTMMEISDASSPHLMVRHTTGGSVDFTLGRYNLDDAYTDWRFNSASGKLTIFSDDTVAPDADRLSIRYDGLVVINDGGDPLADFRVESDSETHMLFVDASLNRVGIGTSGPASTLCVLYAGAWRSSTIGVAEPKLEPVPKPKPALEVEPVAEVEPVPKLKFVPSTSPVPLTASSS